MTIRPSAEDILWIQNQRKEALRKDSIMAPFASWPGPAPPFYISGCCYRCWDRKWVDHFTVWPVPREWPPIKTSDGVYCKECMTAMGVGTDSRVAETS